MNTVVSVIENLEAELAEAREELDGIDVTHFYKYSALIEKIKIKTETLEAAKSLFTDDTDTKKSRKTT